MAAAKNGADRLDDLHGIHQVEMYPPEWDGPAV